MIIVHEEDTTCHYTLMHAHVMLCSYPVPWGGGFLLASRVCSNVCRYVLQNYCSLTGGEVVLTSMWVGSGVTQPLCSIVDLAAYSWARIHWTAVFMNVKIFLPCCISNIVARVSDALPSVYIYTLIYVFHSIGVFHLSLVPFCTGN